MSVCGQADDLVDGRPECQKFRASGVVYLDVYEDGGKRTARCPCFDMNEVLCLATVMHALEVHCLGVGLGYDWAGA